MPMLIINLLSGNGRSPQFSYNPAMNKPISPWQVLLAVGIGTCLSLIGDAALYTVLPTHTADAGVVLASVGILLSANRWVRLATNGAVGWLSDRWPRRCVFVPALFLGALSTAIYALRPGFPLFLLGRMLWGIAWSGIWVAGNATIFDIAADGNRGRWVGYYHISFFLGAASGSLLGGLLTDWVGYRGAMGIAASLTLLGAVVALLFLPETRGEKEKAGADTAVPNPKLSLFQTIELSAAVSLLGINRLVLAGILMSTFGLFLQQLLGDSVLVGRWTIGVATLTGLGLGTTALFNMASAPLVGRLSDRIGNRWRVATGSVTAGMIGFGLLALGLPLAILIGLPLTSFSSGSNQGLSTALVGDLSGDGRRSGRGRSGRYLGILFTVGDLGSAIGPPLAYALLPLWGIQGVYWLCVAALGIMLLAVLWRQGRRQLPLPVK
ncbi:MAG: MFS transporter [Ardenticatenaceae bacterium]|nr:MFS transporter [Ardenticatenaceae bacterium]MCB9446106.1 MFS transporter [Ardenticatenaceae bacterium]